MIDFRFLVLALAVSAGAAAAADLTETDLAALRYFLSVDDTTSADAEIRRLELEFPGSDVKAALVAIDQRANQVDTSPIWRRIDADDFAGARALIAEVKAKQPAWSPPEELSSVLDDKEGQAAFEAAVAAGDLAAGTTALTAFPSILTCDRINNPWRLAEMQVSAGRNEDALATYEGILKTCTKEDFVVSTLQKANEIADDPGLEPLFTLARERNPALLARLDALRAELIPTTAAPVPGETAVAAAAPAAVAARPAVQQAAAAPSDGGRAARARAAADRGDWPACLELTTNATSLTLVNQRAWCAFNFGRVHEAAAGFQQVASSGSGAMARDATYGLILAYAKLGKPQQAAALASQSKLTAEQRRVVNQTVVSKLAVASFDRKQYRTSLGYLDQLSRSGGLDRGLAMMRGWALLKSGQKSAARAQFQQIHRTSPADDSFKGLVEAR